MENIDTQLIMKIIYNILRVPVQELLIFMTMSYLLTPKLDRRLFLLITVPISTALHYIVNNDIGIVIAWALSIAFTLIFFKERTRVKIFTTVFLYLFIMLYDSLITALLYAVLNVGLVIADWYAEPTVSSILVILFFDVSLLVFFIVYTFVWNKVVRKNNEKSISVFLLFPISQCLLVIVYYSSSWKNASIKTFLEASKNPVIWLAIFISIVSDIFIFYALRENTRMNKMKNRLEQAEHDIEFQTQYFSNLVNQYTEIREYRHDINNLISAAEALIETNDFRTEGERIFKSLKTKAKEIEIPLYCSNPIVNAVLYQKSRIAHEKNIRFSIEIGYDESFPIESTEICSVISNILDNALREAECIEEGFVKITARRELGLLFVEVTNSSVQNITPEDKPRTTKENGCHGYGLGIINGIAEKYNGKYILTADGKTSRGVFMIELPQGESKTHEETVTISDAEGL